MKQVVSAIKKITAPMNPKFILLASAFGAYLAAFFPTPSQNWAIGRFVVAFILLAAGLICWQLERTQNRND